MAKKKKIEDIEISNTDKFRDIEKTLRPKYLSEYIGQEKLKDSLYVYIEASKKRNESLDHCLFYGPPGLGKTTLAYIIANELEKNIKVTSGPAIERPGDMASILSNLSDGDVLFIDEIHRLSKPVEEILYPAMEDFSIDIVLGAEASSKSIRLDIPHFTLVGATTKAGLLSAPLRDRFGIINKLEFYSDDEIKKIIKRSSEVLDINITDDGIDSLAVRSRGTPRLANRFLKRVSDFAIVKYDGIVDKKVSEKTLDDLDIDKLGLDQNDRKYLLTLIENYNGGPVGVDNLAQALQEDVETIVDIYEPFLIMKGLIQRTMRGRIATDKAYEHMGLSK